MLPAIGPSAAALVVTVGLLPLPLWVRHGMRRRHVRRRRRVECPPRNEVERRGRESERERESSWPCQLEHVLSTAPSFFLARKTVDRVNFAQERGWDRSRPGREGGLGNGGKQRASHYITECLGAKTLILIIFEIGSHLFWGRPRKLKCLPSR